MLTKTRKPSEESVKAFREWEKATEDLQALENRHWGLTTKAKAFGLPPPEMAAEDKALKASLEATIKRLDPVIARDFP